MTMGAVLGGRGSFDAGGDVVHDLGRDFGVPTRSLTVGSGLSRWNVVTARRAGLRFSPDR